MNFLLVKSERFSVISLSPWNKVYITAGYPSRPASSCTVLHKDLRHHFPMGHEHFATINRWAPDSAAGANPQGIFILPDSCFQGTDVSINTFCSKLWRTYGETVKGVREG
jgi:hypothetical protein